MPKAEAYSGLWQISKVALFVIIETVKYNLKEMWQIYWIHLWNELILVFVIGNQVKIITRNTVLNISCYCIQINEYATFQVSDYRRYTYLIGGFLLPAPHSGWCLPLVGRMAAAIMCLQWDVGFAVCALRLC